MDEIEMKQEMEERINIDFFKHLSGDEKKRAEEKASKKLGDLIEKHIASLKGMGKSHVAKV